MRKLTLIVSILICGISQAQNTTESFTIPSLPNTLQWVNTPLSWDYSNETLTITGGKGSRLFVDPQGLSEADTGPMALFKPDENLSVKLQSKGRFQINI